MKMIVLSEEAFNRLFEESLKELEIAKLREKYSNIDDLYRFFNYEMCCLKDRIIKE
jgi:hypothetical protein